MTWTFTNTAIALPGTARSIRRPAGLSDFAWNKLAAAVCLELNASTGAAVKEEAREEPARTAPASRGVNFLEWSGGTMPVGSSQAVEYVTRDGYTAVREAGVLRWNHLSKPGDIVFWRAAPRGGHQPRPWTPWRGGEPPADKSQLVQVILRSGSVGTEKVHRWEWDWADRPNDGDIVFWRAL